MGRPQRPGALSRGAAALEFALVLPLLLLLVLGGIDWGFYFFAEQVVVNAAREGARAGSLETLDDTAARADAEAAARLFLSRGGLDAASAAVSVSLTGDSVAVQVVYPTGSLTGLSGLVVPDSARALAEMRR
ncbi:MAG: TadE family protein [Myxococcales bacterium]|jgi:Flp pilus assembly protein TadG